MEAQSLRDLVEEALTEVIAESAVAVHPVIGPVEQFEDEADTAFSSSTRNSEK